MSRYTLHFDSYRDFRKKTNLILKFYMEEQMALRDFLLENNIPLKQLGIVHEDLVVWLQKRDSKANAIIIKRLLEIQERLEKKLDEINGKT